MDFIMNFPFITIVSSLFSSVICFAMKDKKARFVSYFLLIASGVMSVSVLLYNLTSETGYFVYRMGHYDAPIGNEISAGLLEPAFLLLFEVVMFLALSGGSHHIMQDVKEEKHKYFCIMVNLTHAALAALCYTNDIFTGYVFIEVCTIASCSLLMLTKRTRALVAATRYMVFSLIGSSLVLVGIILLYAITGHLLFPQLFSTIQGLWATGEYTFPLTIALGLIVSGLAIKTGLFPFHFWMPDTYGTATPAASGILSGVISKAYIFFLLKIIFRVIGYDIFLESRINNLIFIFGICGMIVGSVSAIKTNNMRFMIAYSSAAQIGYIYMGRGLGTKGAIVAALFQIVAHSLTKPMLFLSASGLSDTVGGRHDFASIRSSAHNNKIAAISYSAGALSMVGIPIFAGFIPKLLFSTSAFGHGIQTYLMLIALAISTILNVLYFLRTLINIYSPAKVELERKTITFKNAVAFSVIVLVMSAVNIAVGLHSQPIISVFEKGLDLFINIR
ncbi:MAG: sodium:proton antiporter [Clostridia bacterium]|nr:sodium:proton antiporter [Clostridia bacterium]